ncbi:hypothetical protein OC846_001479 [Tilletia horrida]|uniref:Uncharacterized protein n=1 Tax=Tilletia horrida TaxID=155126 RepID=A0AAN6JSX8_9BASI|nr:hypothetical protein OC845_006324 [Tilletia horrida]KAK0555927.1 hypothetical protein OC846_001479 [Tilletia horrida]KAK0560102.1 hypothetical protein OC861_006409 [Tilletia horrida]
MFKVSEAEHATHDQLEQIHNDAVARTDQICAEKDQEYNRRCKEGNHSFQDMLDPEDGWDPLSMEDNVKFGHFIKINPAITAALKNDEPNEGIDPARLDECATHPPSSELEVIISHDERDPDLVFETIEPVEGTGKGKNDGPIVTVKDVLARLEEIRYDVLIDWNRYDPSDPNSFDWDDASKSKEERDQAAKRIWNENWLFGFCEVSVNENNDFRMKLDAVYYSQSFR